MFRSEGAPRWQEVGEPGREAGVRARARARLRGRCGALKTGMLLPMAESLDPFDLAWREVEAHWTEDSAHRKFIAFCASQGALHEAGRRYRAVRDSDDARRDDAKKRIDAVLASALQSMEVLRDSRPQHTKRLQWVAVGMCVFLVLYALFSMLRARSH